MTDQTPQTTTEPVESPVRRLLDFFTANDGASGVVIDCDDVKPIADEIRALLVPAGMEVCICTTRGDGAEGCGLCNETGIRKTTTPQPLAIGLDRALVLAMEDFINEPRRGRDEHPDVCDYRHGAYRVWGPLRDAVLALAAPGEGYVLVPVDRLRDIVTLSSFLRQGGCDAEDLAGLEYAVESAVDIASACLPAAPTGVRS